MKRSTMWPVGMVVVIVVVIFIAMSTERTTAPDVAVDLNYPHQICTTNRYCAADACVDAPISFVIYTEHEDGEPRIDFLGWDPQASMTETVNGREFSSTGGVVSGTITIFNNLKMELAATSDEDGVVAEHYASGSCSRLTTP
ncbi:MAG: hypothetical protein ACSHWY_06615 [Octadecabacter sp.]